jgi:tRNA(fMet)-specific endonuclease VapC
MTIAELDRWALQSQWEQSRREWLSRYLAQFAVLPYSRVLCAKWAEVTVSAQRNGHRIDCADAWIAASALLYGVPRVTHNSGDYRGVPGLTVISHGQ